MKVNGTLDVAQIETVTSEPALRPAGRVIRDTSTTPAKVKISDGTNFLALQNDSGSAVVFDAGNSTSTKVIDWNNGTSQKVLLTANCVISFVNPQPGQFHRLIVRQAAFNGTSTQAYNYSFAMNDMHSRRTPYQPFQNNLPNQEAVHSWVYSAGISAAASSQYQFNFSATPTSPPSYLEISADGKWVSLQVTSTPFVNQYQIMELGSIQPAVIGPNAAAFTALGANSLWKWNPNSTIMYVGSGTGISANSILADGNRGISMGNFSALSGAIQAMDITSGGDVLVAGNNTTPFMKAFKTAIPAMYGIAGYANPATLPTGIVYMAQWSRASDFLAVGMATSPYLHIYPFNYITGFGTVITPSIVPAAPSAAIANKGLAWHPFGNWIAMITATAPYVAVFPFDRSTGILGAQMSWSGITPLGTAAKSVRFSPCGNFMSVVSASEFIIFPFSPSTGVTGNALPLPGLLPVIGGVDHEWTPNGELIVLTGTVSPHHVVYSAPQAVKNYLKILS